MDHRHVASLNRGRPLHLRLRVPHSLRQHFESNRQAGQVLGNTTEATDLCSVWNVREPTLLGTGGQAWPGCTVSGAGPPAVCGLEVAQRTRHSPTPDLLVFDELLAEADLSTMPSLRGVATASANVGAPPTRFWRLARGSSTCCPDGDMVAYATLGTGPPAEPTDDVTALCRTTRFANVAWLRRPWNFVRPLGGRLRSLPWP